MAERWITVMGSFITDLAFRTPRAPAWGETVMGSDFKIGPGGKGSNQAVAAARLGARVTFICKLGRDTFGDLARATYKQEGIDTSFCFETKDHPTGAASIVVHETKGENAIVVVPGSGFALTSADVDRAAARIRSSAVFVTGLEVPVPVVEHALRIAHEAGVPTILNPAPAAPLPMSIYPLCDYLTPNETEAAALLEMTVAGGSGAEAAAAAFVKRGVKCAIITLGAEGALVRSNKVTKHVAAMDAGPVIETTGAGDAFTGGLATGIAEGLDVVAATRLGCATAGISVTRHGTAPAMPRRQEVNALLAREG
jgi:ribokinase